MLFTLHPYHCASLFVLALLTIGMWRRHHKRQHIACMSAAFVADMTLLLVIEVSRHAVEKVAQLHLPLITWAHVSISLSVVLLYFMQIAWGIQLAKDVKKADVLRAKHARIGRIFYVLRWLNFATSLLLPL